MKETVEELHEKLTDIDNSLLRLFLVRRIQNLKVKMYQEKGHKEPHIHVDYGKNQHVASYSIKDGRRLAGNLKKKYDQTIKEWIEEHKVALQQLWNSVQSGQPTDELIVGIKNA